ncbi:MAG: hypothetical protein GXO87_02615 [Chlorobi bacterium]|nr:hypothetical protein [Chlorobiota bacterium]
MKLDENENAVGLLPVMDLLRRKDFFISSHYGISFEENVSNSFLYFEPEKTSVEKVSLYGDISSNEIILSKIIFSEIYDSEIEITLQSKKPEIGEGNFLISGALNFEENNFKNGVPFSEQAIDLLQLPFVEFVLAGKSDKSVAAVDDAIKIPEIFDADEIKKQLAGFDVSPETEEYLTELQDGFNFKLTETETEAITEILRIPYYHGMIGDIEEINFVK